MKKKLVFFIFLLIGLFTNAQVTFQAITDKKEIGIEEALLVQFELSIKNKKVKNVTEFNLPPFENARILSKQKIMQTAAFNEEDINILSYQVFLQPIKPGVLKIEPARVVVDGKVYETQPLVIKVKSRQQEREDKNFIPQGEAFLKFEVLDKNPYQNQVISAQLKMYTRHIDYFNGVVKFESPSFHGLYVEPVKDKQNNSYKQEVINGETYLSRVIGSYLIYPSKIGPLTINSFKLTIVIPDGLFFDQEVILKSSPVVVNVKKVPDPPEGFYGLVGEYKVKAYGDKEEVKRNEPVQITVEVSGRGNIEFLRDPELTIPKTVEKYEPKKLLKVDRTVQGVSGKLVWSVVLVPRKDGEYKVLLHPIDYFDPETNSFKQLSVAPVSFKVEKIVEQKKTKKRQEKDSSSVELFLPEINNTIDIDIPSGQEIEEEVESHIREIGIVAGLGVILVGVFFLWRRNKRRKQQKNQGGIKETVSNSKFSEPEDPENEMNVNEELYRLKNLAESEEKGKFYTLLESLLTTLIYHSLQVSKTKYYTSGEIEEKLSNKYGDEFVEDYRKLMLEAQVERYSTLSGVESLTAVYQKAESLINKLSH